MTDYVKLSELKDHLKIYKPEDTPSERANESVQEKLQNGHKKPPVYLLSLKKQKPLLKHSLITHEER